MSETTSNNPVNITRLILIPSLITLAITVLRLVGELQHWSETLFNPEAGGGGSIIGITWLAPIFGIYFALKLSGAGEGPSSAGRAIGFSLLGIVVLFVGITIAQLLVPTLGRVWAIIIIGIVGIVSVLVQRLAWPTLFKTLLAYGLAARIPVIVVMFVAIQGNWGTHYDVPPPEFPEMGWFPKWMLIGLFPQLFFWVAFTILTGSLFGSIASALVHRRRREAQAANAA